MAPSAKNHHFSGHVWGHANILLTNLFRCYLKTWLRAVLCTKSSGMTMFTSADGSTLQCGMTCDGMWQVAALSNAARDCGMTCNWIRQVAALCNVACGSGMTYKQNIQWHEARAVSLRQLSFLFLLWRSVVRYCCTLRRQ